MLNREREVWERLLTAAVIDSQLAKAPAGKARLRQGQEGGRAQARSVTVHTDGQLWMANLTTAYISASADAPGSRNIGPGSSTSLLASMIAHV